ncbi:hypothetical protein F4823DRAFT_566350 [Ustulina deusta]|nr:hypothetical protein F4823DRAFT_566350 [Ustulina deusta]
METRRQKPADRRTAITMSQQTLSYRATNIAFITTDEMVSIGSNGANGLPMTDDFGSRALLRYPKIDPDRSIPRTFKSLVALELLVHESRARNCSKLEDKVLAPLSSALHDIFTSQTPDYFPVKRAASSLLNCQLSATDLYTRFARFLTNSMKNLDILSRAHRQDSQTEPHQRIDLPSWVPPFQDPGSSSLIDELLFTRFGAAIHLGQYSTPRSSVQN